MALPQSTPLEQYLPPVDKLTLMRLLNGFGQYWTKQPSLSGYGRYFSASEKEFIVWEGFDGSYDSYGDFEDDANFYSKVIITYRIFWHVGHEPSGNIRVWGIDYGKVYALPMDIQRKALVSALGSGDKYRVGFNHYYASLAEMRQAMLTDWVAMKPTLGETWLPVLQKELPPLMTLLEEVGQAWATAQPNDGHYLVYALDNYVYLARWMGDEAAVQPAETYDAQYQGQSRIAWDKVEQCSVLRVMLTRKPLGFTSEIPRWALYWQDDRVFYQALGKAQTVDELRETLPKTLAQVPFSRKA